MIDDLFDSPWKILIIAVVIIVLFGSRKLPDTARSIGKSMRILKTEITGSYNEQPGTTQVAPAAQAVSAAPAQLQETQAPVDQSPEVQSPEVQAQIAALQEQLKNLERQAAGAGGITSTDA